MISEDSCGFGTGGTWAGAEESVQQALAGMAH